MPDLNRGHGDPIELAKALERQALERMGTDRSKFANRSNDPRPTDHRTPNVYDDGPLK